MGGEQRIPQHVAIIMDGNGRWAKKRLLPRSAGHRAGMNRMIALSEHVFDSGVRFCTLYALSAENLRRPQEEVDALFSLFREYFKKKVELLKKKNIALKVIGDRTLLPADIVQLIEGGEAYTAEGTRGTLLLAIAYGARQEIVQAVNAAVAAGRAVDAEGFSRLLSTAGIPDPDLIIRTGRERRLSNFLLWQAAYAELYFTDRLFPDFSNRDLDRALADFAQRERRFGNV